MALRLRRGTDAQRQLITPAEGELIYTTDTKRLWIGDGSTLGGILANTGAVYGLDDLADVDISTLEPEVGDVLKFNGINFVPGPEGAFTVGGNYYINVVDSTDTLVLNVDDGTFKGNVINNAAETVLNADGRYFKGSIQRLDSPLVIVDAATQNIYADTVYGELVGNVTGDVTGDVTGNVLDDSEVVLSATDRFFKGSIQRLDNSTVIVDAATQNIYANTVYGELVGNVTGDVTGDVTGNVTGNVIGNLTGNVNGTVNGDLIGSVYSDDSTLVIDGTAGKAPLLVCDVVNSRITTTTAVVTEFTINQRTLTDPARNPAMIISSQTDGMFDGAFIQMIGYRGSAGIGQQPLQVGDTAGQIRFSSANFGLNENRPVPVVLNTVITEVGDNVTTYTQGKLQVILLAGPDPMDASITEISKGGVLSTSVLQTGTFADATARDAHFTDRSILPAAGMIIFLTSTSKFQGFNGTTWTDLN